MIKGLAWLGAVALALFAAADAAAQRSVWSPPAALVENAAQADNYAVASSAGGERVAAWIQADGVFVAVAPPGQGFGTARRLARRASPILRRLLVVDGRGDAVVGWALAKGSRASGLYASYRAAGGGFGSPKRISGDGTGADFGLSGKGVATFAWWRTAGTGAQPRLEVVDWVRGGRLTARQALAAGARARDLSEAVGPGGDAAVSWVSGSLARSAVFCALRAGARGFGRPLEVSPATGVAAPSVGVAAGRALIAWDANYTAAPMGYPYREVEAAEVGIRSRRVRALQRLPVRSRGGLVETGPLVRVDARGDAIVVFETYSSSGAGIIHVARSRAGGPLRLAASFATDEPAQLVSAAIGANGRAVVAWTNLTRPDEAATTSSASAAFSKPGGVSPPGRNADTPSVALDAHGNATALWWDMGPSSPDTPGSQDTPLLYATTKLG